MSQKVFVCWFAWDYEGCSEPEAAFANEEDAQAWVVANEGGCTDAGYTELEIK